MLLTAPAPMIDFDADADPYVGELVGDRSGDEGDALGFTVFVYGFDEAPTFDWDFGDGSESVSGVGLSRTSHEYLKGDASYTVTVRIHGAITAIRTMDVQISNAAPVIELLEVQPDPRLEEPVTFRARAFDPGDDDLAWTWDFGDGTPPRTGTDLDEVSHQYSAAGRYTVMLTVADEASETTRMVEVFVGPDLIATTSGAMSDTVLAVSGASNMFAGTIFSASPTPRISVGRTDEFCLVMMGFWDDANKIHVNFLWTPTPDRIFQPGVYPVGDRDRQPGANMVMTQFHRLGMASSYEEAKAQAMSGAGESSNPVSIVGRVLGNFRSMANAAGQPGGDNWPMYGRTGSVEITHASEDQIRGAFHTRVQGPSLRQGRELTVDVEGRFVFRPVSEETGPALQACAGERPFTIASHTPGPNQRLVSYLTPEIVLEFSREFRPATVSERTVRVGYLDSSLGFRQIEGHLVVDSDARHARFTPAEPLKTLTYYRVRVQGGPDGVLSEGGEELPDDLYEWRFATTPRNVPGARGGR